MLLTQSQLLRAVPELYRPRLNEFVASFNMYAVHFGIDNAKRVVHYLAQVFHESGNLRYVELPAHRPWQYAREGRRRAAFQGAWIHPAYGQKELLRLQRQRLLYRRCDCSSGEGGEIPAQPGGLDVVLG